MPARATVIIPTFGLAHFAEWAIQSVQYQSVDDIEICVICDGSPEAMVDFFNSMGKADSRIKVYVFPKSPRTGEPYRDIVIKQTTGKNIFYCSHDDLWLPNHIEKLENSLRTCSFTHSLHAVVSMPNEIQNDNMVLGGVHCTDLKKKKNIDKLLMGENLIGLTFAAHTRKSYYSLHEGWITTPIPGMATDHYMWRKFFAAYSSECRTTMRVTALNFPYPARKKWSEQERYDELKVYYHKIHEPEFLRGIEKQSLRLCPPPYPIKMTGGMQKIEGVVICLSQLLNVYRKDGLAMVFRKAKNVRKI